MGKWDGEYDFEAMCRAEQGLCKFWDRGRRSLHLESHEAVALLTSAILRTEYELEVEPNWTRLCPRVPSRVWYLRFVVERLAADVRDVQLVDIGTGWCAIYLLLLARLTEWTSFVGTDIDLKSVESARAIVELNGLANRVQVVLRDREADLLPRVDPVKTTISICNPPFYASHEEMEQGELLKTRHKRSELRASHDELVTPGGEFQFVRRMILQSVKCPQYRWTTSLVGKWHNVGPLVLVLKSQKVSNYFASKLLPTKVGRTQRWIIGWSFGPERVVLPDDLKVLQGNNRYRLGGEIAVAELELSLERKKIKFQYCSEGCVEIRVERDVWSRRYRRSGKSNIKHDEFGLKVRLDVRDGQLEWIYGINEDLLVSFISFIRGFVKKSEVVKQSL